MPTPITIRCADCMWWRAPKEGKKFGRCFTEPPKVWNQRQEDGSLQIHRIYPLTKANEGCRHFTPRPKGE